MTVPDVIQIATFDELLAETRKLAQLQAATLNLLDALRNDFKARARRYLFGIEGQSVQAATNIFSQHIALTQYALPEHSEIRLYVVTSAAGNFRMLRRGNNTSSDTTMIFNQASDLVADSLYAFDAAVAQKDHLNFRFSTAGTASLFAFTIEE